MSDDYMHRFDEELAAHHARDFGNKQAMMAAHYVISLENAVRRWKRIALILFIAGTAQWVLGWLS